MRRTSLREKGITLVALVVTIIVLLILAGVTINMAISNNGIMQRTIDAKEETEKAGGKEEIDIAVLASYKEDGKIDLSMLTDNLSKITGLTDKNGNQINSTNPVTALPITVKRNNKYTYKITGDGSVENKKEVKLAEGLKIGSIVTYEPTGSTYTWKGKYATIAAIKEDGISTDDDVVLNSTSNGADRITSWKVFKIDEDNGEIQLVPAETKTKVTIGGAPGYNNAVQLLNEACSTLYSNTSNGIIAESIDKEDIEPLLDETQLQTAKNSYNHNNSSYSYLDEYDQVPSGYSESDSYFPRIYEEENKSVINGIEKIEGLAQSTPGSKLYERDEATSLTNQTTTTKAINGRFQARTNIQPYQTYYEIRLDYPGNYKQYGMEYVNIFSNKNAWVASRSICTARTYCRFSIFGSGNFLGSMSLYDSHYELSQSTAKPLFPVVHVDSELIVPDSEHFKVDLR